VILTLADNPLMWRLVFGCLGVFVVVAFALLLWIIHAWQMRKRAEQRRRRIAYGRCPDCGFDLKGTISRRCPECGN